MAVTPWVARQAGMTMAELLVASIIGLVVILGITQVDVTRILLSKQAGQRDAGMALAHMIKQLQRADRVVLLSADPGNIQLRIPRDYSGNFDLAGNYAWFQYKFSPGSNRVTYYNAGCGIAREFFGITGLRVNYSDPQPVDPHYAPMPPGGEPFAPSTSDNNTLQIVACDLPSNPSGLPCSAILYTGVTTLRGSGYTDVEDDGLAPPGVAPAPGGC